MTLVVFVYDLNLLVLAWEAKREKANRLKRTLGLWKVQRSEKKTFIGLEGRFYLIQTRNCEEKTYKTFNAL